jgi:hypothetical protein
MVLIFWMKVSFPSIGDLLIPALTLDPKFFNRIQKRGIRWQVDTFITSTDNTIIVNLPLGP